MALSFWGAILAGSVKGDLCVLVLVWSVVDAALMKSWVNNDMTLALESEGTRQAWQVR